MIHSSLSPTRYRCSYQYLDKSHITESLLFVSIQEKQLMVLSQGPAQPRVLTATSECIKEAAQSDVIHLLAFALCYKEGLCNGK